MKTSVIIATHARPESLRRLIASLAPQLTEARELFVAENGTPSPTALAGAPPLIHLHEPRAGKCRVQNRAIARARGSILVFLDDDLTVTPGYLDAVEQFFDTYPQFAAMKGRTLPAEDPRKVGAAQAVYLDLPLSDHGPRVIEVRGVLGANMAFRADALRAVGPFDERLGPGACGHEEETEMSARLRRAGFKIGYAPGALVHHEVDPARADRARFLRIARERGRCRTLHEHHRAGRVIVDAALAYLRLGLALALRAPRARRARAEKRVAIQRGILEGLAAERRRSGPLRDDPRPAPR